MSGLDDRLDARRAPLRVLITVHGHETSGWGEATARAAAIHVDEWRPDVVAIGAPPRTLRTWLWPGPLHERLVRRLTCSVLITPPPAPGPRRPARAARIDRVVPIARAVPAPRKA